MTRPSSEWGNCFLLLCYLVIRGRVARLAAVSTLDSWFPWHLVALTHCGHAIHFQAEYPHEWNTLAPWWFVGRVQGVRRSSLSEALEESGRTLSWSINSRAAVYGVTLITAAVLVLPWVVAWAIWPIYWLAHSVSHATSRRRRVSAIAAASRLSAVDARSTGPSDEQQVVGVRLHRPNATEPISWDGGPAKSSLASNLLDRSAA